MQSVHARSPHSLVKRDEFVCYTVGPTILPLCFELFSWNINRQPLQAHES